MIRGKFMSNDPVKSPFGNATTGAIPDWSGVPALVKGMDSPLTTRFCADAPNATNPNRLS
jgi:hypothetical protein